MDRNSGSRHGSDTPFQVAFLLIDGFALMSYAAAAEPLRAANVLSGRVLYEITNIPATGDAAISSGGAAVRSEGRQSRTEFDLVLVVASGDPTRFDDERTFNWIRAMARRGVFLGGISGGPVVLARAGVMQGYRMTVHWEHAPVLAELSPTLIVERSLYVIDRDRMTCAGGIAAMDMMHAQIAGHHGPEFARRVSDWFLHTDVRPSEGPQRAGLSERHGTTNPVIVAAIEAMENHVADPLDLPQLARLAGVSPRQLNRLFGEKMSSTTMAFYRDLRLEKAHVLIGQSTLTITEIALATGFATSAHLSRCFKRRYSRPPSALRRQG